LGRRRLSCASKRVTRIFQLSVLTALAGRLRLATLLDNCSVAGAAPHQWAWLYPRRGGGDRGRGATLRRLPPAWVDVRRALAAGGTTFRKMNPKGRGYFGWPAAARAETGRAALKLRARLISQDLISELQAWRSPL